MQGISDFVLLYYIKKIFFLSKLCFLYIQSFKQTFAFFLAFGDTFIGSC